MTFISCNPANGKIIESISHLKIWSLNGKLKQAYQGYLQNRESAIGLRVQRLCNMADLMRAQQEECAALITAEMGKPISQSRVEIERCIALCLHYASKADEYLKDQEFHTEYHITRVQYEPLGVILGIMPWNFPFWQVFRFATPTITAGNAVMVKHASSVPACAMKIEDLFMLSGFPPGVYTNMFVGNIGIRRILWDDAIQGVSLTGGVEAGSKVAELAGRYIKKSVLELGGNDSFIVLDDANLKEAAETAVKSRFQNCGQSCIAAKRWIITEKNYDQFVALAIKMIAEMNIGDPTDEATEIGPMAAEIHLKTIHQQVVKSMNKGAKCLIGGKRIDRPGFWYSPTLLTHLKKGMPAYDEEIFGPVACIIKTKDENLAIEIANDSVYGLSASLWTVDLDKGERLASRLRTGNVYINTMSKSDPSLPFGGIKKSGYGRELGTEGIKAFVNIKTLCIK